MSFYPGQAVYSVSWLSGSASFEKYIFVRYRDKVERDNWLIWADVLVMVGPYARTNICYSSDKLFTSEVEAMRGLG